MNEKSWARRKYSPQKMVDAMERGQENETIHNNDGGKKRKTTKEDDNNWIWSGNMIAAGKYFHLSLQQIIWFDCDCCKKR